MLSLRQALIRRGSSGVPLPTVYPALEEAGARFSKGQLSLVAAPPGAGKSLLVMNLIHGWNLPTLAFLLDQPQTMATARFASLITGKEYTEIRQEIVEGNGDHYAERLADELPNVQTCFYAPELDDVKREIDAYEQRYGLPPSVIVLDCLGSISSAYEAEWQMLKALTLELDNLARETQAAVIGVHHMTDSEKNEPLGRASILGKVSQYARLILSVNFDDGTHEYKIAVVKNSEGKSDAGANKPITLYADPARMVVSQTRPWHLDLD